MAQSKRRQGFRTGEIAEHCEVTLQTVHNWINTGKLSAYATPGGHKRIKRSEFITFLGRYGFPPLQEDYRLAAKILVVEDHSDVLLTIVRMLKKSDSYDVLEATNGFDAGIQILKSLPDLVILDLYMPGMSGFEVCSQIRATPEVAGTRILAITACPKEETLDEAMKAGADACLTKPFSRERLLETVEILLKQKQQMLRA